MIEPSVRPGGLFVRVQEIRDRLVTPLDGEERDPVAWRSAVAVFGAALLLRLLFAALVAGTFDPDEFVVLSLGRAVLHGAVPYRDVTFFHPPGTLLLYGTIDRVVPWWPAGRVATLVIDSFTAVAVWRIGAQIFGRRNAVVAGLVYAASPIALVSAVRIGPDPIMTALGAWGLVLLVTTRSRSGVTAAAVCFALALWTKYTAILYLPIYLLLAGRRAWWMLGTWMAALACLFAPFLPEAGTMYHETVIWQLASRSRPNHLYQTGLVALYWLVANPFAAVALLRPRKPLWIALGFCLGAVFLFTARAYYHYFIMVVPFAALLSAPVLASLARRTRVLLVAAAVAVTVLWGLSLSHGRPLPRFGVAASELSQAAQTAAVVERKAPGSQAILTDQFQYALFAHRRPAINYFWNMSGIVSAESLEDRLPYVAAVVKTQKDHSFPKAFIRYLKHKDYRYTLTPDAIVWLTSRKQERS